MLHGKHAAWELLSQICVVSVHNSLKLSKIAQDYSTRVHKSNLLVYL
jgi:hypothetical protein